MPSFLAPTTRPPSPLTPHLSPHAIHTTAHRLPTPRRTGLERAILQFEHASVTVKEQHTFVELPVSRSGNLEVPATAKFRTRGSAPSDGMAVEETEGVVSFGAWQPNSFVRIDLLAGDKRQAASGKAAFTVELSAASNVVAIGVVPECTVYIGESASAGKLCFAQQLMRIKESEKRVLVEIMRKHGSAGRVSCTLNTKDGTALAGFDYEAMSNYKVVFEEGVTKQVVCVTIIEDGRYEHDESFQIVLTDATGGAVFTADSDGGPSCAHATVEIESDEETRRQVDALAATLNFNADKMKLGANNWAHQFAHAFTLETSEDDEDDGPPSVMSYVVFVLAFPWNVLFALSPPPSYCSGWMCASAAAVTRRAASSCCAEHLFTHTTLPSALRLPACVLRMLTSSLLLRTRRAFFGALSLIGLLTAVIGDLANHVGCCLGLSTSVTAITIVALGTSLPDTFASMASAQAEPYADASIGNVTGSNSVNVFLGLGLPWAVAAVYWGTAGQAKEDEWRARYEGEPWYTPDMPVGFAVPAGQLGYSVTVFVCCAMACLFTFMARRALEGAELGGPPLSKMVTSLFFVALWVIYIVLSATH